MTDQPRPGWPRSRPPERYGDVRPPWHRAVARLLAAAVVVAGLGWVVWAGLHHANRDVRWDEVGFSVVDDSRLDLTFDVIKDPEASATCRLEALNVAYAVVGVAQVEVGPADGRTSRLSAPITTQERAVSAVVKHCELT